MKKNILLITILILGIFQMAFGVSKVAVLDATIGNGVDTNASAIVADTINEQFVKSNEYIAIDRAYISKIQAEKKFQLSGEVSSDDVKELGALFGAQFICVANVSRLGATYTVSARMIDVATAQIVSQESAKMKGEIDVLFDVAKEVGDKLVGKNYTVPEAAEVQPAEEKPQPQTQKPPRVTRKTKPRSRLTFGFIFPGYTGNDNTIVLYDLTSSNIDYLFGLTSGETRSIDPSNTGIDINVLTPYHWFYSSFGLTYTTQSLSASFYSHTDKEGDNFHLMDIHLGMGGIYSAGPSFQFYGGLTLGYLYFEVGDFWTDEGESAGGISFGIEAGADYFLGSFCLSIGYRLAYSGDLTGDNIFTDASENSGSDTSFGISGLILSAGFSM